MLRAYPQRAMSIMVRCVRARGMNRAYNKPYSRRVIRSLRVSRHTQDAAPRDARCSGASGAASKRDYMEKSSVGATERFVAWRPDGNSVTRNDISVVATETFL